MLGKSVGVGVMVRSDRRAQTNIKKANQKSKDRRTTDVKSEHKSSPVESEWMKRRKTRRLGENRQTFILYASRKGSRARTLTEIPSNG